MTNGVYEYNLDFETNGDNVLFNKDDKHTLNHKNIVNKIKFCIESEKTCLLIGRPGTGKTSMVFDAAKKLKIPKDEIVLMNTPLIDPFTDIIGVPVPVKMKSGRRVMKYARPDYFYKAKIIFFDEINRAPSKTLNTILEIVQMRSICGEKLPHLKSIIMAGNEPDDGLQADPFEGALTDRINFVIKTPNSPNREYFVAKFGEKIANILLNWWNEDLNEEQKSKVSPRRLEYIGILITNKQDPVYADTTYVMNSKVIIPWTNLYLRLNSNFESKEMFLNNVNSYKNKVLTDINVAQQFVMALDLFKQNELYKISPILENLPNEMLNSVIKNEKLWNRILDSMGSNLSIERIEQFSARIKEKIKHG